MAPLFRSRGGHRVTGGRRSSGEGDGPMSPIDPDRRGTADDIGRLECGPRRSSVLESHGGDRGCRRPVLPVCWRRAPGPRGGARGRSPARGPVVSPPPSSRSPATDAAWRWPAIAMAVCLDPGRQATLRCPCTVQMWLYKAAFRNRGAPPCRTQRGWRVVFGGCSRVRGTTERPPFVAASDLVDSRRIPRRGGSDHAGWGDPAGAASRVPPGA